MADLFATTFIGVRDGTKNPPDRTDGRLIGAKASKIVAPKLAGQAINIGDQMFIGTVGPNESIREFTLNTDTSLGTTTFSIGTKALPAKYRAAGVFTAPLDIPTNVGPRASTSAAILTAPEDIWVTFAVAAIPGAVVMTFETEISSVK